MKKFLLVMAVIGSLGTIIAQNPVDKKANDSFVFDGELIEAKLYYDNGNISQTGYYTKENKLHGEWTSYDLDGNKTAVAKYSNGEKVGVWTFYQGDERKEVTYVDSKIAEVKTWKVSNTRVVSN